MPTDADASPSTSALLVVVLTVDYTTGTGETLGLGGALAEWLLSTPPPTPAPLQPGAQPRPWWLSTRTSSPSHWQPPVSFYAAVGRSPSSCTRRGRELRLNYRGGSSWSLHVALSLDDAALRSLLASDSLTYHYCVLDEHDGVLRREAPPEHRGRLALHEPASAAAFAGPAAIVVHDTWQVRCRVCVRAPGAHSLTPSLPHSLTRAQSHSRSVSCNVLGSRTFTTTLFRRRARAAASPSHDTERAIDTVLSSPRLPLAELPAGLVHVIVSVFCVAVEPNQSVFLVGGHERMGQWAPSHGIRLSSEFFPLWSASFQLHASALPIEYKYVIATDHELLDDETAETADKSPSLPLHVASKLPVVRSTHIEQVLHAARAANASSNATTAATTSSISASSPRFSSGSRVLWEMGGNRVLRIGSSIVETDGGFSLLQKDLPFRVRSPFKSE